MCADETESATFTGAARYDLAVVYDSLWFPRTKRAAEVITGVYFKTPPPGEPPMHITNLQIQLTV